MTLRSIAPHRPACLLVLALAACPAGGTGDSATTSTSQGETAAATADAPTTGGPGTTGTSPDPSSPSNPDPSNPDPSNPDPSDPDPTTADPSVTGPDPDTTDPDTTDPDPTNPDPTMGTDTGEMPPPLDDQACQGYATRYWDCCKAHCGWQGNVNPATTPVESCDKNDQSHGPVYDIQSSCQTPAEASAFTCYDEAPWAVSDTLAYGFAAIPGQGDVCGRCYQLQFDGTGHYNAADPGSVALTGKTMIVQATNIGFDVGGGQFDILTPGGGVGLFDACSYQWGVQTQELGATYGGFMTFCQQQGGDHEQVKQCVLGRCAAVFDDPGLAELAAGCEWYVNWYEAADNPNLKYQEVACPPAIVAISGIDRGPLDDITACMGGGGTCSQEEMDNCDCSWTNNGQNCGMDDGSCCWTACCA